MPTGHGSYDPTTGIYTYGEADPAGAADGALFSDFLNLLANSVKTAVGSILTRLTSLEAKAILQNTAGQSLANNAVVTLTYDNTDLTNTLAGAFSIAHSTGLLTCAKAGTYKLEATADFAANATGSRELALDKAPSATPTVFAEISRSFAAAIGATVVTNLLYREFITCAVGDVLRMGAVQSSGAALTLTTFRLEIKQEA